jgi:hypothetical protein
MNTYTAHFSIRAPDNISKELMERIAKAIIHYGLSEVIQMDDALRKYAERIEVQYISLDE